MPPTPWAGSALDPRLNPFLDPASPFLAGSSSHVKPTALTVAMASLVPPRLRRSDRLSVSSASTSIVATAKTAPKRKARATEPATTKGEAAEKSKRKRGRPTKAEKAEIVVEAGNLPLNGTVAAVPVEQTFRIEERSSGGPSDTVASAVKQEISLCEELSITQEVDFKQEGKSGSLRSDRCLVDMKSIEAPDVHSGMPEIGSASTLHVAAAGGSVLKPVKGKKGKAVVELQEVRPARFRAKCPKSIMERVGRVMSQRMFMLDRSKGSAMSETFRVLGSTGNVYTTHIGLIPQCDCPDCLKGNSPCKHILFIFLKVLKVPESATTWYQKGLLVPELQEIFTAAPPDPHDTVLVSLKVKNAYLQASGHGVEPIAVQSHEPRKISSIDEDCPVCYEMMTAEDDQNGLLEYDEALSGCGKGLHKQCFQMWAMTARNKGDQVTCVWCRTPWPSSGPASKGKGGVEYTSLGYMNMGSLAGMARQRDTSSYYQGPMRGRRMTDVRYEDD